MHPADLSIAGELLSTLEASFDISLAASDPCLRRGEMIRLRDVGRSQLATAAILLSHLTRDERRAAAAEPEAEAVAFA